jgi:hypothetical protein
LAGHPILLSGILPNPESENPAERYAAKVEAKTYSGDEACYKKPS